MRTTIAPEAVAAELLDKVGFRGVPPVDPVEVAQALGVSVKLVLFRDPTLSGALNGNTIYVDVSDHPNRQRFTIAHELGHYLLHREFGQIPVDLHRSSESSWGTNPREIEANAFAAALLMPEQLVKNYWNKGIREPSVLARLFAVSEQSMRIRLERLGLTSEKTA